MKEKKTDRCQEGVLTVETPLGTLVAYASTDPGHPGIYIDFKKNAMDINAPIILTEYVDDEGDLMDDEGRIITRVWGNMSEEDYSERIVHCGINQFFSGGED